MIEAAVAYIGAYLGRKLLDRVGSDIDDAFEKKLTQLYRWVKAKFTGRPGGEASLTLLEETPDGEQQQALVASQLAKALGGDEAAAGELGALLAELDRIRPPGLVIKGLASADDVHGKQVGVSAEGPLPEGSTLDGTAEAKTLHEGGESIGVHYRSQA